MALINCPECNKEVSSLAMACPNCGCPLQPATVNGLREKKRTTRKKRKVVAFFIVFCFIAIVTTIGVMIGSKISDRKRLEAAEDAVVKIVCFDYDGKEISTGSGFFFEEDDEVVTNHHVISDAYSANIITNDGNSISVKSVLYASNEMDLAVLKLEKHSDCPYLTAGEMSYVKKGREVYAIGSPLGIKNTLSSGIVSGRHMVDGIETIQFTAPISSGSSGGALLDKHGNVIGITFASYESGQNLNLAVPVELLESLYETDKVSAELSAFNKDKYLYAMEISKLEIAGSELVSVEFDEYRKDVSKYVGEVVVVEAYISSKDKVVDSGVYKYFVTDQENVSGDLRADILSWGTEEDSPYLSVSCDYDKANRVAEFEVGEKVCVVALVSEEEGYMFHTGFIVYNDDKCFSIVNYILKNVLDEETYNLIVSFD